MNPRDRQRANYCPVVSHLAFNGRVFVKDPSGVVTTVPCLRWSRKECDDCKEECEEPSEQKELGDLLE